MFPPPDEAMACCEAAVFSGHERCSCWTPVLDLVPSRDLQAGPMRVRKKSCHDCAYRAGSPEREAAGGALPDYGRSQPFLCHQGMPRAVRFVHPPTGAVIEVDGDDYHPVTAGERAWLADGRLAEYCAGWAKITRAEAVR